MTAPVAKAERAGVIIIGSNSVRMLTANLDGRFSQPVRGRRETRLFLRLHDSKGQQNDAIAHLTQAVGELVTQALASGAKALSLFATAALREVEDISPVAQALKAATGLDLQVISGQQEAAWSYLGAVWPYGDAPAGVVDIGGGSTELAYGKGQSLSFAHSLPLGAARLSAQKPILTTIDVAPATALVQQELATLPPLFVPDRMLLVGGTGVALVGLLAGQLPSPQDPRDFPFTLARARGVLGTLAGLTPEKRLLLPGMTPGREMILPSGLVVLTTLMEHLGVAEMSVTQRNNADGCLWQQIHQG